MTLAMHEAASETLFWISMAGFFAIVLTLVIYALVSLTMEQKKKKKQKGDPNDPGAIEMPSPKGMKDRVDKTGKKKKK